MHCDNLNAEAPGRCGPAFPARTTPLPHPSIQGTAVISLNSHHPAQRNRSPQRRRSAAPLLVVALLTMFGATLGATSAMAVDATPTPSPTSQPLKFEVLVPRATGPVEATTHEFRFSSDGSLITDVPTLLRGQRVDLLWRGLPGGDWLGTLTRSDGVAVELGLVAVTDNELLFSYTVPAGLAGGSYTVAFRQNNRQLTPTFGFILEGAPAPTGGSGTSRPSSVKPVSVAADASGTSGTSGTSGGSNAVGGAGASGSSGTSGGAGAAAAAGGAVAGDAGAAAAGAAAATASGIKAKDQPVISVGGVRPSYEGSLNPFDGALEVSYTVTNTGNVPIVGDVDMVVRGPVTIVARSAATQVGPIAPGKTQTYTTRLEGTEQAGPLRIAVRLVPHASKAGKLPNVYREATALAVPWSALALLALGGGAAWLALRRRRAGTGSDLGAGSDLDGSDRGDGPDLGDGSEQLVGSTPARV
jgi:hypothetical protein